MQCVFACLYHSWTPILLPPPPLRFSALWSAFICYTIMTVIFLRSPTLWLVMKNIVIIRYCSVICRTSVQLRPIRSGPVSLDTRTRAHHPPLIVEQKGVSTSQWAGLSMTNNGPPWYLITFNTRTRICRNLLTGWVKLVFPTAAHKSYCRSFRLALALSQCQSRKEKTSSIFSIRPRCYFSEAINKVEIKTLIFH